MKMSINQSQEESKRKSRLRPLCWQIGPDYAPQVTGQKEEGSVIVWRLPPHLSQSKLGDRTAASNACTIIALKMAEALHSERISVKTGVRQSRAASGKSPARRKDMFADPVVLNCSHDGQSDRRRQRSNSSEQVAAGGEDLSEEEQDSLLPISPSDSSDDAENLNFRVTRFRKMMREREKRSEMDKRRLIDPNLVNALANSILDGNQIHEWAVIANRRAAHELNFTIPDAIGACGHVFVELDYKTVKGNMERALEDHISAAVHFWNENKGSQEYNQSHLFLLLIAHERTVLVLYQPTTRTVALVDSHSHGRHQGAVVAAADVGDLPSFCTWIILHIFPETMHRPEQEQEFEISLIRYSNRANVKWEDASPSPYATRSQVRSPPPKSRKTSCWNRKGKSSPSQCNSETRHVVPEMKGKIFVSPIRRRSKRKRVEFHRSTQEEDVSEPPRKGPKTDFGSNGRPSSPGRRNDPPSCPKRGLSSFRLFRPHSFSTSK